MIVSTEAIIRLAGLPVALPNEILARIHSLAGDGRRWLFKRLIRTLGRSPVGSAHVLRLFGLYASERPSYFRYFRAGLRVHIRGADAPQVAAWLEVLRLHGNDFCYIEAFKRLPTDVRLLVAWAHADRIFRIIANAGAELGWVRDNFGNWSTRLPAEIAFTEDDYTRDVCNPRRIDEVTLALAGCAYATDFGSRLDETLRDWISSFVEANPEGMLALMRDFGVVHDALSSILRHDDQTAGLFALTSELRDRFSAPALRPQVAAAVERIRSGEAELTEWGIVNTMTQTYSLLTELGPILREGLLAADLVALHRKDSNAALIAGIVSARHAGTLGQDIVAHVRIQLLALAGEWNRRSDASEDEIERAANVLVSAAFSLLGTAGIPLDHNRFQPVAELLDQLLQIWSAIVDRCQFLSDRLVEGLPNVDSRSFLSFRQNFGRSGERPDKPLAWH